MYQGAPGIDLERRCLHYACCCLVSRGIFTSVVRLGAPMEGGLTFGGSPIDRGTWCGSSQKLSVHFIA